MKKGLPCPCVVKVVVMFSNVSTMVKLLVA